MQLKILTTDHMKFFLIFSLLLGFFSLKSLACDIEFTVDPKTRKEVYKKGDEIIILVTVKRTHRNCTVPMDDTRFIPHGMRILKATDWNQVSSMVWERKLMMTVTGTKDGKLILEGTRECKKEDSRGVLQLKSTPL